ncbi:MAG: SulP family inorganic anion transporter [Planctomycetes bacterium]|nr:SulP family inorganic anion transporter [Planctomycetota bacterium]
MTTSSMVFAVLAVVAPGRPDEWPAIAALLAVLTGTFIVVAAFLKVGQFVRFVSRSVLVGLTGGAAILIFGSQLAPFLGVEAASDATLIGILWRTLARAGDVQMSAVLVAGGAFALIMLGTRFMPRFPTPFAVLVFGGVVVWLFERTGLATSLQPIERVPLRLPDAFAMNYSGTHVTDLIVGAAALALVGIIQTLAIAKSLADRSDTSIDARRELLSLGTANVAAGILNGFPGAGSFSRSGLNEMAGARTRLSGIVSAAAIVGVVALAAPLTEYITRPVIAGLLMATAWSIVKWRELGHILTRRGYDRIVLLTTIACVFIMPIHWAILIGLTVSIAAFLRRVSRLYVFEMVAGPNQQYHERPIDDQTGRSLITMIQIEGPLFFAHAEELSQVLSQIFERGPRVTIIRMRRTQQIDFSVVQAMDRVVRKYARADGTFIVCGLTQRMRAVLRESPLGKTVPAHCMLQTTGEVFGSAHKAIELAKKTISSEASENRVQFRSVDAVEEVAHQP